MFGCQVVASTRRGRGRLFAIDVLALDNAGTPVIVECKWDRIGERAIKQLRAYRHALKRGWRAFEERVGRLRGQTPRLAWREPLLIAVGYRLDPSLKVVPPDIHFVTYSYHGVALGSGPVDLQVPGEVSFEEVSGEAARKPRHPKVVKTRATHRRLARFTEDVRRAFWEIDEALRQFGQVEVTYGGKNFVRYRGPRGRFAEAVIGDDSIEWFAGARRSDNRTELVRMTRASDRKAVIDRLRRAYDV